jgi:hypothetical protein
MPVAETSIQCGNNASDAFSTGFRLDVSGCDSISVLAIQATATIATAAGMVSA